MFPVFSSKAALKVFPGFIPMFSVLRSYCPLLIFSLITLAD